MEMIIRNKIKLLEEQIDLLPIGICVVDQNLDIQQWNRTLNNWTSLHAQIAIGSNLLELFPHLKSPRFLNRMTSVFKSGQPAIFSPSSTHPFLPNRLDEEGVEQVTLHKTLMVPLGDYGQLAQISLTDVTTQYEQIKELRKEKELHRIIQIRNQAILETAADSIITITSEGNIESFNTAAEYLFDYSASEVTGNNIKLLIPTLFEKEDGCDLIEIIDSDFKYGLSQKLMGKRKNETNFPICMSMSEVVIDLDNSIESTPLFTIILRDLTERYKKDDELRNSREKALAADRSKSEFLANMSHEIRTPMTAILGYTDLLAENNEAADDPQKRIESIDTIRNNANHLLTIINDILDMSKIEAGKMSVELIDTHPVQIIEEVLSLMKSRAIGKGLDIRVQYEGELPERIISDPTRLRQILMNLMGNAIKFTEIGTVTIRVSMGAQGIMLFSVIDTGIGMTPEQRDVIAEFDAFTQADGSTTRKFGGSGLGLRISNTLSKMLGGGIDVQSVEGIGSTFTASIHPGDLTGVSMLTAEEHASQAEQRNRVKVGAKNASNDKPLDFVRVLLVEDGPDNQRLIQFVLKKAGAEVKIAENGQIAIEKIHLEINQKTPFDVVLMDMQMPVLDGYSATRKLREQKYTGPIIALTAHAMTEDRNKCLKAGCNDFASKPIDRENLINLIQKYTMSSEVQLENKSTSNL